MVVLIIMHKYAAGQTGAHGVDSKSVGGGVEDAPPGGRPLQLRVLARHVPVDPATPRQSQSPRPASQRRRHADGSPRGKCCPPASRGSAPCLPQACHINLPRLEGLCFVVWGSECRVSGSGFRFPGSWFRVPGSWFRFSGFGFRV